jgi:hypothetical protein
MGQTYARAEGRVTPETPETSETSGRHSIAKSPARGGKIWKISRHGVVKRDPNFHEAPEGAMRSVLQGGKEVHW